MWVCRASWQRTPTRSSNSRFEPQTLIAGKRSSVGSSARQHGRSDKRVSGRAIPSRGLKPVCDLLYSARHVLFLFCFEDCCANCFFMEQEFVRLKLAVSVEPFLDRIVFKQIGELQEWPCLDGVPSIRGPIQGFWQILKSRRIHKSRRRHSIQSHPYDADCEGPQPNQHRAPEMWSKAR